MLWRRKKPPTVLESQCFQLKEIDSDLLRLKAQLGSLRNDLSHDEHMISYHSEKKATAVGFGADESTINFHDAHISDLQNKALGLASRIADAQQAIDQKRQERLDLIRQMNQTPEDSDIAVFGTLSGE